MYQDKISLENFFVSFLIKEGSSLKTQKNYVTDLREFFIFLEGTLMSDGISSSKLQKITENDVHLYKKYLAGQQKSEATIQRRLSSLRTFFHACKDARLINHIPLSTQKESQQIHPLIHVWKGHLKENDLPIEMTTHVHDFLTWIHQKRKN